ncbi:unnamed protein product [Owenia fusiformis]|uniref:Uncharacterized protein n=1 Tax=Owenia fusiformis TaxID=6347 RepID=A0A8S4NS73_OWEFU|nr:unnamed protein product [Owenia fusiformis]
MSKVLKLTVLVQFTTTKATREVLILKLTMINSPNNEEDTDTDTIIDESDDSLSEEATDVIDEKFCAVDLEHIIPNTVSRKRKKVHNTLDDKLDALSDVTFSESSSSSDTDSSWSPSESGISTIHRKKRRKTKNFIERDDNNGSHDNGSEKQDTKPNMNFYLPRKVTFPFKMVSKVGGRTNNKDEYKGQGHVRTLLPKPKVLCYNIAPAKAMAKCVAASIKDREKSDVTTAATQSGADAQKQSTINTQKQSVQNATSPVKNHWPTFPLNLLPQRVLSKSIKSKGKIIMNNRPRLSIPQNNQQRLQVNKNNQPRLPIPQSNQPRLTISQNNQPRLLSQTNQPITMILQNNQQMAMTPQMNQPRPTIIQTIEPRAMIQQNLPEPKAVISPNNQPIVTIDPSKTTPNILRLPIVPQNILPQNILPQNILPQNVIYIPQSATPGTLVNPTSVNSSAVYPTAVNPTAVNPSAVNPSVVNPTAVNPTTVNPTAVNPTVSSLTKQQPVSIIFQSRPGQNVVGDNVRVLPQNMVLNYQRLAAPVNIGVKNAGNKCTNVLFQNSNGAQNIVLRSVAPWTVGNALNSTSDDVTLASANLTPNSVTLQHVTSHTVTSSNVTQSNVSSGISIPHTPSPNIAVCPPNIPLVATFQNPCQQRAPAQNIDFRKISPLTLGNALNYVNQGVTPENMAPNRVTLHNVSSHSVAPYNVIQKDVSTENVSIFSVATGNATPSSTSAQSVPQGTVTPQSVTPTFRISSPHVPLSNIVVSPPNIPQVATFQNPSRPRMPAPTTLVPATKVKSSGANQYTIYPHCLSQPNVVPRGAVAKAIFPGGILTKVPNTNTTPQAVSTPVTSTHLQTHVPLSTENQHMATYTETKLETRVTKPRNIKPKPTQPGDSPVVSMPWKSWKPPTGKRSKSKSLNMQNTEKIKRELSEHRIDKMPWRNPSPRIVCLWKKYVKTYGFRKLKKCVACQEEVNDRITPSRIAALDESYNLFKKAGLLNESQYYMADLILPYICASCTSQVKMFEVHRERYLKYYMNLINMKTSLLTAFGHDTSQSNGFEANIMQLNLESSKPDAESGAKNAEFENEKKQDMLKQKYGLKTSQQIRKKYLKNIHHPRVDHKLNKNHTKQNSTNEASEGSRRPKGTHQSLDDQCKIVKLKKIKMKRRQVPRPLHKSVCTDTTLSVLKDLVDQSHTKAYVQSNQSSHPLAKLVEATSSILKDSESSSEPHFTKKLSDIAPPITTIPSPITLPKSDSPASTEISALLPSVIGKDSESSQPYFTKKLSDIAPPITTIPSPITLPKSDSPASTEISTLLPSVIGKDSESSQPHFTEGFSNIAPPIATVTSPITLPESDSPASTEISIILPSGIGTDIIGPPVNIPLAPISPLSDHDTTEPPAVPKPSKPIKSTPRAPRPKPTKPVKSTPRAPHPSSRVISEDEHVINEIYRQTCKPNTVRMKLMEKRAAKMAVSSSSVIPPPRILERDGSMKLPIVIAPSSPPLDAPHTMTIPIVIAPFSLPLEAPHTMTSPIVIAPSSPTLEAPHTMTSPIVIAPSSPTLEAPHTMTSPIVIAPSSPTLEAPHTMTSSMLSLDRSAPITLPESENHRTASFQKDTPLVWSGQSVRTSVHDSAFTVQDDHMIKDEVITIDEDTDEETITDESFTSDEDVHSFPINDPRIKSLKLRAKWRSNFISAHTRSIRSAQVKKSKFLGNSEALISVKGSSSVSKNGRKRLKSVLSQEPLKISSLSAQASVSQEINTNSKRGIMHSNIDSSDTVQSEINSSGSVHPIINSNGIEQLEIDSSKMVQSKLDSGETAQLKIDSVRTVEPGIELEENVQSEIDSNATVQLIIDSGENVQPEMTNVQQGIHSNESSQSEIELIGQEQSRSNPIGPQDQMAFVIGGEWCKVVQVIPDSDCAEEQIPRTMSSEPIHSNIQLEKSNLQSGISNTQPGVGINDVQSGTENRKILNMPGYSIQVSSEEAEKTVTIQSGTENKNVLNMPGYSIQVNSEQDKKTVTIQSRESVVRDDQLGADDNILLLRGPQFLHQPVATQTADISLTSVNTVSSLAVNASSTTPFCVLVPSSVPPSVEESEHAQNDTSNMYNAEPWIERRVVNGPRRGRGTVINLAKNDNDVTVGYLEPAFIQPKKRN